MMRTRTLLLTVGVLLLAPVWAHAQQSIPECNKVVVNALGTSGADITVDATAGGVGVLAAFAKGSRCGALICNKNTTYANSMRCDDAADEVVTSTVGKEIFGGQCLLLGFESYGNWKCIRTTSNSVAVDVTEWRR